VALEAIGLVSAYLEAFSLSGLISLAIKYLTMEETLAVKSPQLEGNFSVDMGMLSV
jgi:hypothetical protein